MLKQRIPNQKLMKSLHECIASSMDCKHVEILPYLPYILQDFEEIGTISETIIQLIKKHKEDYSQLKVLDLGCGKGAVSIKISVELNCSCLGIDGMEEFIVEAKNKAIQNKIDHICSFEVNDIRERIATLEKFDVIILGSVGPVFGNYHDTLFQLSKCLKENGILIIDDGYYDEAATSSTLILEGRSNIINYGKKLGILLIDEFMLLGNEELNSKYDNEYETIVIRCKELIEKYPSKTNLFIDYYQKQKEEYENLKNNFIGSTMVFKK